MMNLYRIVTSAERENESPKRRSSYYDLIGISSRAEGPVVLGQLPFYDGMA